MRNLPILEHVVLDVTDGPGFEAAYADAIELVLASEGCRHAWLRRCLETADRYLLLIEWDTLEAHTVGFRESDAFPAWREQVGPFFVGPPDVEHYELVASTPAGAP